MTEGEERDLGWMAKNAVWHGTNHVSPDEYILWDEYPLLFGIL